MTLAAPPDLVGIDIFLKTLCQAFYFGLSYQPLAIIGLGALEKYRDTIIQVAAEGHVAQLTTLMSHLNIYLQVFDDDDTNSINRTSTNLFLARKSQKKYTKRVDVPVTIATYSN
jgi:hypothetical protein